MNIFSVCLFGGVIVGILLKVKVSFLLKRITREQENLQLMLSEMNYQQQVIYNVSTSIFLLHDVLEIIRSTISEIIVMYKWPDVAYFSYESKKQEADFYGRQPKHQKSEVLGAIKEGEAGADFNNGQGEYASVFLVGDPKNPLGVLYASKTGSAFTEDQSLFFKTITGLLTIAVGNIMILNKR